MEINVPDYKECCCYYRDNWALTDRTLYDLCERYPAHNDPAAVNAKVLLIGRGFASGIERNIPSKRSMGSALGQLATHLIEQHDAVDGILSQLAKTKEPLTADAIPIIVAAHGRFCQLLRQITQKKKGVRSFASKYLHFHCPRVPMIDSNSYACAWKMRSPGRKSWARMKEAFAWTEPADWDYYCFVLCFWHVYTYLQERRLEVSVRLVDQYLLWHA